MITVVHRLLFPERKLDAQGVYRDQVMEIGRISLIPAYSPGGIVVDLSERFRELYVLNASLQSGDARNRPVVLGEWSDLIPNPLPGVALLRIFGPGGGELGSNVSMIGSAWQYTAVGLASSP